MVSCYPVIYFIFEEFLDTTRVFWELKAASSRRRASSYSTHCPVHRTTAGHTLNEPCASLGCVAATLHPHTALSLLPALTQLLKTQQAVGRQHFTHTQPLHYCLLSPSQLKTQQAVGRQHSTLTQSLHYCPLSPTPAATLQASLLPSKPLLKKNPKNLTTWQRKN